MSSLCKFLCPDSGLDSNALSSRDCGQDIFPSHVKRGAIFNPDMLSRLGVIRHLGLEGHCSPDDEEPCA